MINSFYRLWAVMSWNDFITLVTSLSITLAIGGSIMYFIFTKMLAQPPQHQQGRRRHNNDGEEEDDNNNNEYDVLRNKQNKNIHSITTSNTGGTLPAEVAEEVARKIRQTPAHKALLSQKQQSSTTTTTTNNNSNTNDADTIEKKVEQTIRRNIPLGASSVLIQKGARLVDEGSYDEALVCFLALLYSAVEGGKAQPDNLPAHLAECLRGAGTCYRKMGQIEVAARFFQAERLIYEEMVASLSGDPDEAKKKGAASEDKSRAIVASLFRDDDKNPELSLPRRCRILQEVAKQCMKHGHVQVALSYQLKMAAVKRKVSGKAMEPNSEEFHQIAEMLRQLSPEEVKAAQQAAQSEDSSSRKKQQQQQTKNNADDDE